MAGAFWQNPKFSARFRNPVSVAVTSDTSPTPESTALYAANAAAAAARAEAAATATVSVIGTDSEGNLIVKVSLPDSAPSVAGALWDNGGFVMVSDGD